MRSQFLRISYCGFFSLIFFVSGCTLNGGLKKPEGEREFFMETSRLEKLAREDPSTSIRAKSHLQLAFLYVNSRNPQLNYSRALLEMESYFSMSSEKVQRDDFQNWFSVLKELDRVRKDKKAMEEKNHDLQTRMERFRIGQEEMQEANKSLRDKMDDLQAESRISLEKVQEANKSLRDKVARLQELIEKLKNLDYQMEEKRDRIK
jgi:hypothetical protein